MRLAPVREVEAPRYPQRLCWRARLERWSKRIGVAAWLAAAAAGAGCYGLAGYEAGDPDRGPDAAIEAGGDAGAAWLMPLPSFGIDAGSGPDRGISWCEPEYRLSGEAPPTWPPDPLFACGSSLPASTPTHANAYWIPGNFCGDQAAWARVQVDASWAQVEGADHARVQVSLWPDNDYTRLALLAPDGTPVLELTPEHRCAELDAEYGPWTLAARPVEGAADPNAMFELWFEPVWE